ncbi:metal-dependent transcriptional regulator [Flectobacillus longus]|jgi:DtxR family Mn-dependent transcriptional regulator|uniref:Transcriptional regulator MntR n=1 Tax=Flectobacillus longus TaxID=2984207 RepID=A0ABT6YP42_9BACT|nr:metal-dependent transcriptional regulator [Flectobacillus longus]MDI9865369.1 metal-dependent transcriptional regulator [Flectobacillus longus]MDI9881758.1 metal-dependent transcriptional regulator [Flectobacillus longus]
MQITSFTEENYLKIIYKLSAETDADISTNAVAELTQTKAASVSDMLRKLSEKHLVNYQKYQGVRLTEAGEQVALKVIRKHRLWEVFLVEKLGFNWDEVHDIAEQLEHIDSEELVEKLDEFLEHPKFDPHGDPIPDPNGRMPKLTYQNLSEVKQGERVLMMGVSEHSSAFLQYVAKLGISLGSELYILEINDFDKSLSVQIAQANPQFMSHEVAKNLLVKVVK